jgi:RNA polymerase sigma-70 factor (family 1)
MRSNLTDLELFDSFAHEGNREAFDELYQRYWGLLYKIAKTILDDSEAARDVVQDVFVSFLQFAPHKAILNVKAYLLQSAKYQCFMRLRAGKIAQKHLQRLDAVSVSNDVEETLDAHELEILINSEIAALPEKCREVFYLSRMELLSNQKIAQQLQISPKTVEKQITKALKSIRVSVDKLAILAVLTIF